MKPIMTGGCLCGAVRYEIAEAPAIMGCCHCRSCQRATGSAYYPFMFVTNDTFKISGPRKEYAVTAASGFKVYRSFCTECGSMLGGRSERWPHGCTVSAASLDEPSGFKPEMHVWTEDAQHWDLMDPSLPAFKRNRDSGS